jgi:branched-subunit amino acid transport protein AzlD
MAGAAKLNAHYSNRRGLLTVANSTIIYISIIKTVAAILSIHDKC